MPPLLVGVVLHAGMFCCIVLLILAIIIVAAVPF